MNIPFTKMHGAGNDFIMIDHRQPFLQEDKLPSIVRTLCTRKLHIGANGLILLEKSDQAHFSMRYFNRDGSEVEMCGNGARCTMKFAYHIGACKEKAIFETMGEIYEGTIESNDEISIAFPNVSLQTVSPYNLMNRTLYSITVGVPHVVLFDDAMYDATEEDFHLFGEKIRYMTNYFPNGTNVNVVKLTDNNMYIRTYERGVEEETLACGTGATASAIIAQLFQHKKGPTTVEMKGGIVHIHFQVKDTMITNITLTGKVFTAFQGTTTI